MNAGAEITLTLLRELRRNLRSAKGLLSALLFLAGGIGTIMTYLAIRNEVVGRATGPAAEAAADLARRSALTAMYGDPYTADFLMSAPLTLLFLYNGMLLFVPVLAILLGYDQLASELQFHTMRYTALRARRSSLVVGKALGSWISVALFSLGLCVFAWVIVIQRSEATSLATLTYGARFWLLTVVYTAPFVALTSLVSGAFTTPMLALLSTLGAALGWASFRVAGRMASVPEAVRVVRFLAPGEWEHLLVSPNPIDNAIGAGVIFAMAAVVLTASCIALRRRDL